MEIAPCYSRARFSALFRSEGGVLARLVDINGHIVPSEQALVSAWDHGLLYGDGVYETLRTYDGVPFLLDRHLARLRRSADRIRIPFEALPVDAAEEVSRTLLAAQGNEESLIRILVTRGPGPLGYAPELCPRPSLLVYVLEFSPPSEAVRSAGIKAALVEVRRNPKRALDPEIKSNNLLNNILAGQQAHARGAEEGILLNLDGHVAECTTSNIFAVRGGRVLTPPVSAGILEGLTREFLLETAARHAIPCAEETILPEELLGADEVFLTSTTREVMPVVRIDETVVGAGVPGPVTRRLMDLFHAAALASNASHAHR